jgi:gluconokinase
VRPEVAAVSLGTSGAMRVVVPTPTVDPARRLFCYALTDDAWVVGGSVNNGGSVVRWASHALAVEPGSPEPHGEAADELDARLLEEAAQVPAGSAGLLCLPYLLGERAPWWRSGLRGAYIGLRREHRRPHLVRAAVEGVCQQLALVRDAFAATDLPVREVAPPGSGRLVAVGAHAGRRPRPAGAGRRLTGGHRPGRLPARAARPRRAAGPGRGHRTGHRARSRGADPADAAVYRELRPLVERSTDALTDVLTALDALDGTPTDPV